MKRKDAATQERSGRRGRRRRRERSKRRGRCSCKLDAWYSEEGGGEKDADVSWCCQQAGVDGHTCFSSSLAPPLPLYKVSRRFCSPPPTPGMLSLSLSISYHIFSLFLLFLSFTFLMFLFLPYFTFSKFIFTNVDI